MRDLTLVRCTAEGELVDRKAEEVDDAFLDERKRLHRLRCGPIVRETVDVPRRRVDASMGVHDGDVHAVVRLDDVPTDDFNHAHEPKSTTGTGTWEYLNERTGPA